MMEIIVSHAGADFDAYASMVAAHRLYPEAKLVTMGKPAPQVAEFLSLHQGQWPVLTAKHINPQEVSTLVIVDTSNPQRLGPFRMLAQQSGVEVHIYDHHPPSAEAVSGDVSQVRLLGAAVTVVLEELLKREPQIRLTVPEATLFLIAIYEETGNLTYSSTTPNDLRMAAWLLEQGAKLALVREILEQGLNEEQRQLRDRLLTQARRLPVDGAQAILLTAQTPRYVAELNEVVSHLLQQEGCDLALAAVTMGEKLYIVGRSRHPRFNLLPAFQALGGGGHPCAASAAMSADESPQEVLLKLLPHLRFQATDQDLVKAHMTPEVQTLELHQASVQEAAQQLRALNRNATVVVDRGKVVGMLARSDLDKALEHGLGSMPASSVMTQPVLSVSPETPLEEARQILIRHDVGRLPVLEGGQLKGIISRTDVLRHLYDTQRFHSQATAEPSSELLLRLPWRWLELLKRAGEIAKDCRVEVFAVGGFVRDLLLERLDQGYWDLDLCVEGSVDEFLENLGESWKASLHRHPRFETATLILPDGQKVDVARARQESYVRPAALPEVQSSNLKQDLYRRDFTINALALRLTEGHFGQLVDFFGGQADLNNQVIRVLHNHSFIDDPTRILRAVRLEQRLGFHLSDGCEHLLRAAVRQGMLPLAGPDRVRDEIVLCLSEGEAVAILERLNKLRVLNAIHPDLAIDPKVRGLLQRARQAILELAEEVEFQPWKVYVRAWLHRWKPDELQDLLEQFHFRLERSRSEHNLAAIIWRLNRESLSASQVYQLMQALNAEEIVVLWALNLEGKMDPARVQERILHYLRHLKPITPMLTGHDILQAGVTAGPRVAQIKAAAFANQLDHNWTHNEQAQKWLQAHLADALQ